MQSYDHRQIFVMHKLYHQFRLWPVMADGVELIDKWHMGEPQRQLRSRF